jgi:hypothetical protein
MNEANGTTTNIEVVLATQRICLPEVTLFHLNMTMRDKEEALILDHAVYARTRIFKLSCQGVLAVCFRV